MDALTQLIVWLNNVANAVGKWTLSPIAWLPGWLSATAVALVTGVLMLAAFKYTSNQRAIKRARDDINANLLALKLFKDSASTAVRSQGRILLGAGRLFLHALVPMAVMALPATLILGQLSLWYQQRPLRVGEEAVVTMALGGDTGSTFPEVSLRPTDAAETLVGPVRVLSKREICWNIKARAAGEHKLVFQLDGQSIDKQLAVGDGFDRTSARRPGRRLTDVLMYPAEPPFGPDSPIRSIEIDYPGRSSWTSGRDSWLIYWFVVSMVGALCFRRVLKVNV